MKKGVNSRLNGSLRPNNDWIEKYRRWVNLCYRLHFGIYGNFCIPAAHTDGNHTDSIIGSLESRLQSNKLNILVLDCLPSPKLFGRSSLNKKIRHLQVLVSAPRRAPQQWVC